MSEEVKAIVRQPRDNPLAINTKEDMWQLAKVVVAERLAPASLDTPGKIFIAMTCGAEIGMPPMRSMQSFCVINGAARMYGDAPLALVRQSGLLEYIKEYEEGEGDARQATCETKRKGDPKPHRSRFSVADAKRADLWGKRGPWTNYPARMLMYRARSFNLRDNFPDVFGGATIAEEYEGVEDTRPPATEEPLTEWPDKAEFDKGEAPKELPTGATVERVFENGEVPEPAEPIDQPDELLPVVDGLKDVPIAAKTPGEIKAEATADDLFG